MKNIFEARTTHALKRLTKRISKTEHELALLSRDDLELHIKYHALHAEVFDLPPESKEVVNCKLEEYERVIQQIVSAIKVYKEILSELNNKLKFFQDEICPHKWDTISNVNTCVLCKRTSK